MDDQNNENEMNSVNGNENVPSKRGTSVANKAIDTASKKATKNITKKIGTSAAKKSLLVAVAPVLTIAAVIILLIILTVGIAVFLNTLPGIAMDKLKGYGKKMANGLASWFGADSTEQVDDKLIYDTLTYLEQVGYDLKGYGFVTDYMGAGDVGDNQYLDEDAGVVKDKETDEIKKADSDFIMAYLVSDNYVYTLANNNLDTEIFGDNNFFGWLIRNLEAVSRRFVDFFGGSLGAHWTTGLITLWHEDGEVGHRGSYYSSTGFLNFDDVKLDPEKRELILKRGFGGEYKYKLDGWTGRYGMPMEFLLSIHFATMMPDLAYDMANTFETKVNILLHPMGSDSYLPYIENVINHWYRNVYYTSMSYDKNNEKEPGKTLEFIDYDYAYEDVMKERWTLYETDEKGDYILYVLSDKGNGEYATSASDVNDYSSSHIESRGDYYIYKGTREDAIKENVAVSKKAATVKNDGSADGISYEDKLRDIKWGDEADYSGLWTAYKQSGSNIIQEGDAIRGETNPEIKKMFLQNTYFKYDGTQEKAEAIKKLRDEYHVGYGSLNATDSLNPDNVDLSKIIVEVTTDTDTNTYKASDLTGKVMLNQDSLNTFSMLENTKTLDADYIYRDFKELVVELGYYEKEEVTDETPRLLAWIIPEIGSYGFPKRELDKIDSEFGTMAHSRLDYIARDNAIYWRKDDVSNRELTDEGGSDDAVTENSTETERHEVGRQSTEYTTTEYNEGAAQNTSLVDTIQSVSGKKKYFLGAPGKITDDFREAGMEDVEMVVNSWALRFNKMTAHDYYQDEESYKSWLQNKLGGVFAEYAGEDVQGEGDGDSFVDAEKYVYGLLWIAGFEYCAGTANERCDPLMDGILHNACNNPYDAYYGVPGVGHSHLDIGDEVGSVHIDKAMVQYKFTTNCNYTTDKVYYKAGLFGNGDDERPTSSCEYKALVNKYGAKIVTEFKDLHLGDLIECFTEDNHTNPDPNSWSGWKHVLFVGEEDEESVTLYTTGHDFINTGDFRMKFSRNASRDEYYYPGWVGLHLWDLEVNNEKYEGYKGNEAVVSPVTGILLDYGTYGEDDDERINVDLKYNNLPAEVESQGVKYAIDRQEYKDQVGYAKIMVLDAKNYKKLEASMNSSWKNDSLLETSEVDGTYKFRDDNERLKDKDDIDDWSQIDRTVYGYKEFVEKYEKYGIAGNIIYIDGFKCESVDRGFHDAEGQYPEGEEIKMSDFAVSQDDLKKDEEDRQKTKYKKEKKYHSVSKTEEDRINAEATIKKKASPSVGIDNLIFIKEGTVLGRTLTDRELIEKDRNEELGKYKDLRVVDIDATSDYKVIGNYIRMIMRDKSTDTVVENIEDYMKLDDGKKDAKEKDLRIMDDFDVTDPSNFPDLEEFLVMFADYPVIIANAEAFIAMQNKYGINAAFAACVTIIESSGGTNGELVGNGSGYPFNWFSISGSYNGNSYTTQNGRTWRAYESYAEAVDDFGNLIKNSSYYVVAGRRTVSQIGERYCVPPDHWVEVVNGQLKQRYGKITSKHDGDDD